MPYIEENDWARLKEAMELGLDDLKGFFAKSEEFVEETWKMVQEHVLVNQTATQEAEEITELQRF